MTITVEAAVRLAFDYMNRLDTGTEEENAITHQKLNLLIEEPPFHSYSLERRELYFEGYPPVGITDDGTLGAMPYHKDWPLTVQRNGASPGLCREYFIGGPVAPKKAKRVYCRQEDFPGRFFWYSCTGGSHPEPDTPLADGLWIQIADGEKVQLGADGEELRPRYVLVENAGQDDERVVGEFVTHLGALHEQQDGQDVMRRCPDGSLTTEV